MEATFIKIAQVIIAFAILIILHEGGHFIAAKLFKIRVEKFYLFFDAWNFKLFSTYWNAFRKLIGKKPIEKDEKGKFKYSGTEYGIGWLPLGGYVKISGMIDESMDKEQMKQPPQPWEFRTKPAWQRLIVMLGGIIVNFITAFIIYIGVLFAWGENYLKPTDITYGMKFNEQAIADGFRDGDQFLKIDNTPVRAWDVNVLRNISNAKEVTVKRQGKEVTLKMPEGMNMLDMVQSIPPYADILIPMNIDSILPGSPAATIGLKSGDKINAINQTEITCFNDLIAELALLKESVNENSTAADSLKARTVTLVVNNTDTVNATLTNDFKLGFNNKIPEYKITNKEYGFFESIPAGIKSGYDKLVSYVSDLKYLFTAEGAKSMSGIVGITNIFPAEWDWQRFWLLTALLSIALGVMNVLPIPALDGGHAVFALYEIITRRKPSEKVLEVAQYVGFIIIIALMILATWNDFSRIFGW